MGISILDIGLALLIFWAAIFFLAYVRDWSKYGIYIAPMVILFQPPKLTATVLLMSERLSSFGKRASKPIYMISIAGMVTTPLVLIFNIVSDLGSVLSTTPIFFLTLDSLLLFLLALFIGLVVHEIAHAFMAIAHEEQVEAFGFGFVGIFFTAFTKIRKPSVSEQINGNLNFQSIIAAGIVANLVLASLMLPFAYFSTDIAGIAYNKGTGALVVSVEDGSPADIAGISRKEVILQVARFSFEGLPLDQTAIVDFHTLVNLLAKTPPGTLLQVSTNQQSYILNTTTSRQFSLLNGSSIGVTVYHNFIPKLEGLSPLLPYYFTMFIQWMVNVNLVLGFLNFLPMPFMDGEKLLRLISPKLTSKRGMMPALQLASILLLGANILISFPY